MTMARRRRRSTQWRRYMARYITPARGGLIDNALPVGSTKALFRVERMPWTWDEAYWVRAARRSTESRRLRKR